MTTNSAKPCRPVPVVHSTSGSVHDSQPALLKFEQMQCKKESSIDSRDFSNPTISEINKDDTSQYPLDARHDDPTDDSSPGPGAYNIDERSMQGVYPSSPRYSFGLRLTDRNRDMVPGPGSYYKENQRCYKKEAPHYSFGTRHSMKKALFIVEYKD